mmetsp:Transcript_865/g.2316  ORF Transcript_865/g.2316 Transcript_865/m.2316 type:complete len:217 (-) Transcript_865:722-1372(-)
MRFADNAGAQSQRRAHMRLTLWRHWASAQRGGLRCVDRLRLLRPRLRWRAFLGRQRRLDMGIAYGHTADRPSAHRQRLAQRLCRLRSPGRRVCRHPRRAQRRRRGAHQRQRHAGLHRRLPRSCAQPGHGQQQRRRRCRLRCRRLRGRGRTHEVGELEHVDGQQARAHVGHTRRLGVRAEEAKARLRRHVKAKRRQHARLHVAQLRGRRPRGQHLAE